MSKNNNSSYKSILKSISAFGSMQVITMIIGIITTKAAALFLGPNGIGLLGLIKNAINLILSSTNFGFSLTSVKEIAEYSSNKNKTELKKSIYTVKHFSIGIGILGMLSTMALSTILSNWIFGEQSYYPWFLLLSINFLLLNYNLGLVAILQGLRKMKLIVYSGILVSIFTMVFTIPSYFFLKQKGIIPAILLSNLSALFINLYYTKKLNISKLNLSLIELYERSKPMLKLGFLLSINIIFGYITHFLIKLYLKDYGASTDTLGFYEASIIILTSYFGVIFNVMSIDFYPKLTSFNKFNRKIKKLVNDQIELALLLVTPLIIFMYLFSKLVLKILYSSSFENVEIILKFGLLSIIIKAISWPLGYILLAKNNKNQYFYITLISDVFILCSSIFLYLKIGLLGLGLTVLINHFIFGIYIYLYVNKHYEYSVEGNTIKIIFTSLIFGVTTCISSFYFQNIFFKVVVIILLIISIIYSLKQINKKIDCISFLKRKLKI